MATFSTFWQERLQTQNHCQHPMNTFLTLGKRKLQTQNHSGLTPNASVARKCCSSKVLRNWMIDKCVRTNLQFFVYSERTRQDEHEGHHSREGPKHPTGMMESKDPLQTAYRWVDHPAQKLTDWVTLSFREHTKKLTCGPKRVRESV